MVLAYDCDIDDDFDQVEQIGKEQNYQRYREERFRSTSENTNQRVLWSVRSPCTSAGGHIWVHPNSSSSDIFPLSDYNKCPRYVQKTYCQVHPWTFFFSALNFTCLFICLLPSLFFQNFPSSDFLYPPPSSDKYYRRYSPLPRIPSLIYLHLPSQNHGAIDDQAWWRRRGLKIFSPMNAFIYI